MNIQNATSSANVSYHSPKVDEFIVDQSCYNSNNPVVENLSIAFGEATKFATTTVEFQRGDLLSMMVVFYDNLKGLRARGVVMERVRKGKYKSQPDAFPANPTSGCTPPPNWKG